MAKTLYENNLTADSDQSEGIDAKEDAVYQIVNGLDAEVTLAFEATHSEDKDAFKDGVSLGSMSIGAGNTERESLAEPWDVIRVSITTTTTPTTGTLTVYEHD